MIKRIKKILRLLCILSICVLVQGCNQKENEQIMVTEYAEQ